MAEFKQITIDKIKEFNQDHLLQMLTQLTNEKEKSEFIKEVEDIDFELMAAQNIGKEKDKVNKIEPVSQSKELKDWNSILDICEIYQQGLQAIARKEGNTILAQYIKLVGIVILGGGQGSRLGFEYPKGMYKIGLLQDKSLFQLHCERALRIMQLVNEKLSLALQDYRELIFVTIMCSEMNLEQTKSFFEENKYFGLNESKVRFFVQGKLPAIDCEGKILLEDKGKVCMAPNGNGSFYTALYNSGTLQIMKDNGIKYIHEIAVDNALVKIADPFHIGYAVKSSAPIICKAVKKTEPHERVGVHVFKDGKPGVKEYTEIKELAELRDLKGELLFNSAAILNNVFKLDWIYQIFQNKELSEYHDAFKKIKYYSVIEKQIINPQAENCYKFELFIFDAFELAPNFEILHVPRETDFAPIKNPIGSQSDAPEHAVKMIQQLNSKWLGIFNNNKEAQWEVSPLVSYEGEGLEEMKGRVNGDQGVVEIGFFFGF